jgi:hypothetical protein
MRNIKWRIQMTRDKRRRTKLKEFYEAAAVSKTVTVSQSVSQSVCLSVVCSTAHQIFSRLRH